MSAQAITVYQSLLASGIDESRARRAAEAIDEAIRDKVAAAVEEKTDSQFVRKDEYAQRMESTPTRGETDDKIDKLRADMNAGFTETRADMNAGFAETRAGFAEVRSEMREVSAQTNRRMDFFYRALITLIVFVAGGCVGIAAAAVKFIFGV